MFKRRSKFPKAPKSVQRNEHAEPSLKLEPILRAIRRLFGEAEPVMMVSAATCKMSEENILREAFLAMRGVSTSRKA